MFKLQSGEPIGVEEISYKMNYIFQAKVESNKALIYHIDMNYLNHIFIKERHITDDFINLAKHKI